MNEIHYGKFKRSFKLPQLSDSNKVNATFKDGQLNIIVNKSEQAQRKVIPIQ